MQVQEKKQNLNHDQEGVLILGHGFTASRICFPSRIDVDTAPDPAKCELGKKLPRSWTKNQQKPWTKIMHAAEVHNKSQLFVVNAMAFMESGREVPLNDDVTEAAPSKFFGIRQWLYTWRKQLLALALIGITFLICLESANEFSSFQTPHVAKTRGLPGHLAGVNLGGWLCLEDWFYSGNSGLHVSTIDHDGQGRCLPPLRSIPWTSEGNLTFELNRSKGVLDLFKDVNGATNQRYLDDHVKDVASHHPSLFDGCLVGILFSIFSTVWGNDPDSSSLI